MKYSIRGNLQLSDGSLVVEVLNRYTLWKLDHKQIKDENTNDLFTFEAWLNAVVDKDLLFDELKLFVRSNGIDFIGWHECTHDEPTHKPCVPAEEYRK